VKQRQHYEKILIASIGWERTTITLYENLATRGRR